MREQDCPGLEAVGLEPGGDRVGLKARIDHDAVGHAGTADDVGVLAEGSRLDAGHLEGGARVDDGGGGHGCG